MVPKDEFGGIYQSRMGAILFSEKSERTGEIHATFRTSIGWKIDEKILSGLMPGM